MYYFLPILVHLPCHGSRSPLEQLPFLFYVPHSLISFSGSRIMVTDSDQTKVAMYNENL